MKRLPAFQDLSRDHHTALLQARDIKWYFVGHEQAKSLTTLIESFLTFWEDEALLHFREEEELLLPQLEKRDDQAEEMIQQVLSDHRWLRNRVNTLISEKEAPERAKQSLKAIGSRLHDHVRFEERVVFERFQEVFDEEDLEEYHEKSIAFRREWRGESAIGPR
jgi:iron-sulfur cluster repair protein YtfE (RIC family)